MQQRLEWQTRGDRLRLDVRDYRVTVWPAGEQFRWRVSSGEHGYAPTLAAAKELGLYHLRLTLEDELPNTQDALTYLDHLDDETDADRAVYTRGMKRRQGT